jgi:hypothetical protein
MAQRLLDAVDLNNNTARFCEACRDLFVVAPVKPPTRTKLFSTPRQHGLAKGFSYALGESGSNSATCELCLFLRAELGDGDTPVAYTNLPFGSWVRAFTLPGK